MQTISQGYRGVRTVVLLNLDLLLTTAALVAALHAAAYVALL